MSDSDEKSKSPLGTALLAIGLILTTVANIAGIMQLKDAPILAVVIVLTAAAIVLALYALSERKHKKTVAAWLASGAMLCAICALGAILLSMFGSETNAFKRPDTGQPSRPLSNSQSKDTPPLLDKEMTFWLDTGADIDVSDPKVEKAQEAIGSTDISFDYGTLSANGMGFYKASHSSNLEQTCREVLESGKASEETIRVVVGFEYCLRTSSGNIASVRIVEYVLRSRDTYANLAIKVWRK